MKSHVLMCDFDGTITVKDTAEWVLETHADGDWKALDKAYGEGRISLLECMRRQFSMVRIDHEQILMELDEAIGVRPGFPDLVHMAKEAGADFLIVSAGLDFVIDHYLDVLGVRSLVRRHSARTKYDDGHISFEFPPLRFQESTSFKDDAVRQWHLRGSEVTYIGDGIPDADACSLADHRFVVRGSRLEAMMLQRDLEYSAFDDFMELLPTVKLILER